MLFPRLLLQSIAGYGLLVEAASIRQTTSAADALASITITNIDDVRGNLFLPSESGGLEIKWESSDPAVIASDGIVKRQDSDALVRLTASINGSQRTFDALVRKAFQLGPLEAYAFAYFTNNTLSGENVYFAASQGNNALQWNELNNARPVLTSTLGTKGLRDPFIIRSPEGDTFYLLATDLSIGSGTSWDSAVRFGSRYLEVWKSHDLKTWSAQQHVLVSPEAAGNTWAPEAAYDSELGAYVVFWASAIYADNDPSRTGTSYQRMYYATTRDFVTFSKPQLWQDVPWARIDSTVIKDKDTYYRFTKDEGGGGTGCQDIIQETSASLRSPASSWTTLATCIGRNAGTSAVEGPAIFRTNPGDVNGQKFYLLVDEYSSGGRGYVPLETTDLAKPAWKVPSAYKLPRSPRHGTVIGITAAEHAALTSSFSQSQSTTEKRRSVAVQKRAGSPVLPGYYADPNMVVFGKNYYIYATTDGFPGWGGQEFYWWRSPNLVDWTRGETPFLVLNGTSGNVPWATGNAWAPTIIERGGKYYFYFSGNNPTYNRKTIGVAVADHPEGPFTAQPQAMILNNERSPTTNQAIDPAVFRDPATGKHYLFWGNGVPLQAELGDDMVSIKWETLGALTELDSLREGMFLVYRNGTYHMTYSIDDTGSENYRVGYATASAPTGPYTYRGVILQKDPAKGILATGHDSVVNVPCTDDWYIAYHRFGIPNGSGTMRETTIDRLWFNKDTGLIEPVVPTLESVPPQVIQC